MKVLLVEDSRRMREALKDGLRSAGYVVDVACDGEQALAAVADGRYDVVILDLMLPKLDGLTVLRRMRDDGHDEHVLILTARDAVCDRVLGLNAGADDFLIKPFAFEELLARVQALVRRRHGAKRPRLVIGAPESKIEIDTSARAVRRGGAEIALAPREYALLEYLAMRAGHVVSRLDIEEHIYGGGGDPNSNVVDAAVCALRRQIDLSGRPSLIETRRGVGYLIRASS